MKMMLLAAAAALTLGSATAFASDGGDWYPPNTPNLAQDQAPQTRQAPQQAVQQSIGSSHMYFSAAKQTSEFNANFGGSGNG